MIILNSFIFSMLDLDLSSELNHISVLDPQSDVFDYGPKIPRATKTETVADGHVGAGRTDSRTR